MTLRYVDKDGEQINEFRWRELQDDQAYRVLARHDNDEAGIRIEACWVGVWLSYYEAVPKPFILDVVTLDGYGCKRLPRPTFHAADADALKAFAEAKRKMCAEGKRP